MRKRGSKTKKNEQVEEGAEEDEAKAGEAVYNVAYLRSNHVMSQGAFLRWRSSHLLLLSGL